MLRIYLAITATIFFFAPNHLTACGYSFIGDCSTGLQLKINNTLDSFQIAPCPFGIGFDGLDLGEIQTLRLVKGRSITWESCQNNVSAVSLYYRVYLQGNPGGAWSFLPLAEDYNTLEGPYTARYRSALANINLVAGLTVGSNYVLEVYMLAAVDTIGDDFIPETTMLQDNNGQNYHLNFKYGGPTGPPFTVVKTIESDVTCAGDSTGIIGVSVYGDQSGLFYQWSNVNNNFFAQFNLPAGAYSVTVSGSSGYTQAQSFLVEGPAPLVVAESADICSGGSYMRGNQVFTQTGAYTILIPGSSGCDTTVNLNLQVLDPDALLTGLPELTAITCAFPSLQLCATPAPNANFYWYKNGEVYSEGLCTVINTAGTYTITGIINGALQSCTAAKTISVEAFTIPPTVSTTAVPASAPSTPNGSAQANFSGGVAPYTFSWSNGGTTSAITGLLPGPYCVSVYDANGCSSVSCVDVGFIDGVTAPIIEKLIFQPTLLSPGAAFTIVLPESAGTAPLTLQWIDAGGRLLESDQLSLPSGNVLQLCVPNRLPAGMFFLRLFNQDFQGSGTLWLY